MRASDHPAVAALTAALAAWKRPGTEDDDAQAHAAVCAMTDALRLEDWPVEAVIVEIKRVAADAGIRSHDTNQDLRLSRAVAWCIQRYYGT